MEENAQPDVPEHEISQSASLLHTMSVLAQSASQSITSLLMIQDVNITATYMRRSHGDMLQETKTLDFPNLLV